MIQKTISVIFFISWTLVSVQAQQDSLLKLKQVEVVKTFEAQLEEAQKIHWSPIMPAQKDFNPAYTYDITIVPVELQYPEPSIRPLAMDGDAPFIVRNGFVHAGYGWRKNPYILGGYSLQRKDKFDIGIVAGYESLDNSERLNHQKYSEFHMNLNGSYLLKENLKIYGSALIDSRYRQFYNTAVIWDSISPQRQLHSYSVQVGLSNPEMTAQKLNYDVNLTLRNMSITEDKARDNGMTVRAFGEKLIGRSIVLRLDGLWDYHTFMGEKESDLSVVTLTPTIKSSIGPVIVTAGIDLLYGSDGSSSIFPKATLSYGLWDQKLQIFAHVDQNHYVNNFAQVSKRNNWLNTSQDSIVNTVFQEYSGGVKGGFSFLTYQMKAGYKNIRQQMFMLNNRENLSVFDMVYDDMGAAFISGNTEFLISSSISIGGWLTYNLYRPETFEEAWHLPALEGHVFSRAGLLNDKLWLTADVYTGSRVPFLNSQGETKLSNLLFDLNVGAEYHITDTFRVFVQAINILDNRFERFYGNPSVGINGMAGVKWVF